MPSLIKFLVILLILGGLFGGGMVALAIFVKPTPSEMVIRIPAKDLK